MNITTQELNDWKIKAPKANFIHLKDITFAEYNIVYYVRDFNSVKSLSDLTNINTSSFISFDSDVQYLNLILIDSIFSSIIADLGLNVFLKNVSSIKEYITKEKEIKRFDSLCGEEPIKYKFFNFIHLLVYSNIASEEVSNGNIDSSKIYYFKNKNNEIQYYSIYEQNELQLYLIDNMKLEIDLKKSFIEEDEATICLRIFI